MTGDASRPDDAHRPWRLFVALPVPASNAARIHDALAPYRRRFPEVRWMPPRQYHVTLRFLGSVAAADVPAVEDAVRRCAGDGRASVISVGRGGGTTRRSEVAWLEVSEGIDGVTMLADGLDALLPVEALGDHPRARPRPHLTIARRAPQVLVDDLRDGRLGTVHESWVADRVTLYRSFTGTPTGSRYEVLSEAPLDRPPDDAAGPSTARQGAA